MIAIRAERGRLWSVLGLLVVLQFALRPRLGMPSVAPDFLMVAASSLRETDGISSSNVGSYLGKFFGKCEFVFGHFFELSFDDPGN